MPALSVHHVFLLLLPLLSARAQPPYLYRVLSYDFDNGNESWAPVFADYNLATAAEGLNATVSQISPLPPGGWVVAPARG